MPWVLTCEKREGPVPNRDCCSDISSAESVTRPILGRLCPCFETGSDRIAVTTGFKSFCSRSWEFDRLGPLRLFESARGWLPRQESGCPDLLDHPRDQPAWHFVRLSEPCL